MVSCMHGVSNPTHNNSPLLPLTLIPRFPQGSTKRRKRSRRPPPRLGIRRRLGQQPRCRQSRIDRSRRIGPRKHQEDNQPAKTRR